MHADKWTPRKKAKVATWKHIALLDVAYWPATYLRIYLKRYMAFMITMKERVMIRGGPICDTCSMGSALFARSQNSRHPAYSTKHLLFKNIL